MEFEMLSFLKDKEKVTATYYAGDNSEIKEQISVKRSDLAYPDDFMYACAYLIDELAKKVVNEPYKGKTVCIASNHPEIFKVGKIYEWKYGRTVGEDGLIHPTTGKLFSLDEIRNTQLKFIEIVED